MLQTFVFPCFGVMYYAYRLIAAHLMKLAVLLTLSMLLLQCAYHRSIIDISYILASYESLDIEMKAALTSSVITIFGVFVSISFASMQWRRDANTRRRIDIAGNLVSIMHDFSFIVNEFAIFAGETKKLILLADAVGFENADNDYRYWVRRRKGITMLEEKLWNLWHEYNRWTAIGKGPLTSIGASKITDKTSEVISNIKIKSSGLNFFAPEGIYPDLDTFLARVDLVCVDEFIYECKKWSMYISVNGSVLNDLLLAPIKEYTLKEFLFMLKSIPDMGSFLNLVKTGEFKGLERMQRAYKASQKIF